MSENSAKHQKWILSRVSEDWWAVIVALILIALIHVGLIGKVPW